jgi:hypothetical protein
MAYIKKINQNSKDSHQTSPAYLLTFLRWAKRDTATMSDDEFLSLRKPMLVVNDCISLSVSSSKSNHIHTASMILLAGDINYSTAVAPGDFVMVNMLDNDEHLFGRGGTPNEPTGDSLYSRATNKKPINKAHDGFKGLFKIQTVTRNLQVNPQTGHKSYLFQITAHSFTEFNQIVYFNPNLRDSGEDAGNLVALNFGASEEWGEALSRKQNGVGDIFKTLIGFFLGEGFNSNYSGQKTDIVVRNYNQNFLIPPTICALMNIKSGQSPKAADLFNYYVGIQKYSTSNNDAAGLNPSGYIRKGQNLNTGQLSGAVLLQGEPFGQVTAWSVLTQYSNSLINEMYTTYKLTPENEVMPCLVFRQKPFTSAAFATNGGAGIPATEFLSLPRWKISVDLIESISLGRTDTARVNFVHIVGKTRHVDIKNEVIQQESKGKHQWDTEDIKRNGLRPIITACDFDFPLDGETKVDNSTKWNLLYADWLFNGHLKENGTITCVGIEDPICVGDNLQLENTVYHIESVSHNMGIDADGRKHFKTSLTLSFGVDDRKNITNYNPIYPEMEHTDSYKNRVAKAKSGILPGFSDTQDIAGRVLGEEVVETKEEAFSLPPKSIINKDDKD